MMPRPITAISAVLMFSVASVAMVQAAATGVPPAPKTVTAMPGNASAMVKWVPPTSGGPFIKYVVTAMPGSMVTVLSNPPASPTSPTSFVSGLTNGKAYTFTVQATNAAGTSVASTPSAPTTPATTPDPPTQLTATGGDASAMLAWTAPTMNGGSTITGYMVTCDPGSVQTWVGGTASKATVTALTNGTTYTCTVRAINSTGAGSASASATVTPRTTVAAGGP